MSDSDNKINATEYEYEPFEHVFLHRREQIERLVGVTQVALSAMNGAARLSEVLRKDPAHVDFIRKNEEAALAEVRDDMPLIHGTAAVLIWGALEASVRDFLVRWLVRYPASRLSPELKSVRVRLVEYESVDGEDRMRYLLGILERELAAALRPGVARFECVLAPFGIHVPITDSERRDLNELAAVRNVIVHRAGVADARLLELCPWLGLAMGQEVKVGHEAFFRYRDATSRFAASLIEAARVVAQRYAAAPR